MTTSQILEMVLPSDIVTTVMTHVSADVIVSAAKRWLDATKDAREFRRIALDFGKRVLEEFADDVPEQGIIQQDDSGHYFMVNVELGESGMFFMEETNGVGSNLQLLRWLDDDLGDAGEFDTTNGLVKLLKEYPKALNYLRRTVAYHAVELDCPRTGSVYIF